MADVNAAVVKKFDPTQLLKTNGLQDYLVDQQKAPAPPDTRFQDYLTQLRGSQKQSMAEGQARGEQLFGDGSAMADIVNQRRQFLSGYSPEEQNALRSGMDQSTASSTASGLQQLRAKQGRAGVFGPAAAAQENDLIQANSKARQTNEAGLFSKQIDLKRQALTDYQKAVGDQTTGKLTTEMGYGSLGSADTAAATQRIAGEDYTKAAAAAANSGSKK